jgi:hypothetical protein
MYLPAVQEDPLAMHEEAVLVPGDLQQSMPLQSTKLRNTKLTISCNTSLSTKISFVEKVVALAAAPTASSDAAPKQWKRPFIMQLPDAKPGQLRCKIVR